MASATALLEENDDDQFNEELLEFYHSNLQVLNTVPLYKIDPSELKKIAEMLHSGADYGDQWREYGFCFGIKDYYDLDSIELSASLNKVLPLYMVLIKALRGGSSFGLVIENLICKRRLDVLRRLKLYVQTLLEADSNHTIDSQVTSVEMTMSKEDQSFLTYSMPERSDVSHNSTDRIKRCGESKLSSFIDAKENELVQKYPVNPDDAKDEYSKLPTATAICLNIEPRPSAPIQQKLRVFIMHTDVNASDASRLADILRENGMSVIKYSDIIPFLLVDSLGALTSVFLQVDFIIPIVSESFLHQIHPHDIARYIDSDEAMNNRCFYQLLTNEYRKNRGLNFRVRPVLIPGFDKSLLRNNLILSPSLRLWSEVPKLIDALQSSREILPNFSPS